MTTASSRRRASEEAGVRSCVITSSGKWRADVCALFPSRRRHTRYIGDWSSDVCSSDPSRRRHTRYIGDWSSDVCSSDLFMAEDLNPVEDWIADVNVALTVYRQAGATIRIGQVHNPPEMARRVEDLNAGAAYVDHEHFNTAHARLARESELTRLIATTALPNPANDPAPFAHNKNHGPRRIAA